MVNNIKLTMIIGIWVTASLAACGKATITLPSVTPTATEIPPSPTPLTSLDKVRMALAEQLGIDLDAVQVHVFDEKEWLDSCLGAPLAGETCTEVITPGFAGIMIVEGVLYEFHSDESGEDVRFVPGAALAARQILMSQLALEQDAIRIVSANPVDWLDGCLGINLPNQVCTKGVVKGYKVVLEGKGKRYEYHTDQSGSDVRLALAPKPSAVEAVINWSVNRDGVCESADIGMETIVFGPCQGAKMSAPFVSPDRADEVKYFNEKYSSFDAETPAGAVTFTGKGLVTATRTEQRMIAEWAHFVMLEAQGGRSGAAWGLVFAWHREAGIAGICEDVAVYLNGSAMATSCLGEPPTSLGKVWLNSNQMRSLYTWVDTYQSFEFEQVDTITVGGITQRLLFFGAGKQEATDFEKHRTSEIAAEVIARVNITPNMVDLQAARKALEGYFAALVARKYYEAVRLYDGSYEVLTDNNPSLNPTDYAGLFQAYCTLNGGVCNLQVKNFVHEVQLTDNSFRFTVEFKNPDGSLFVLGPCCGSDPEQEPPWTQFEYVVMKVDSKFLVQDLPVYVP